MTACAITPTLSSSTAELAWLFQHKLGENLDDANMHYKQEWSKEMAVVFGKKTPDLEELIHPQTADQTTAPAARREIQKWTQRS